jgi:hypothetical protein
MQELFMPICPICDDTGLQNSDSTNPDFCYCAAGKQARRQWEANRGKGKLPKPASFIDIANLEQVNASVDAMRSSLLGSPTTEPTEAAKHPAIQLLYHVAHPGHEVSMTEATQLYELAKAMEGFLGNLAPIGRINRR